MNMTLREILIQRGYEYESALGNRAEDIYFENVEELCISLGYILRHIRRFDAEIPEDWVHVIKRVNPNYPITDGLTVSGHKMKYGPEYRIYFENTRQIPDALSARVQNDRQMRMTGSLFVEACMVLGYVHGSEQDMDLIFATMDEIFTSEVERAAIEEGYNL